MDGVVNFGEVAEVATVEADALRRAFFAVLAAHGMAPTASLGTSIEAIQIEFPDADMGALAGLSFRFVALVRELGTARGREVPREPGSTSFERLFLAAAVAGCEPDARFSDFWGEYDRISLPRSDGRC
jgi:hypothetical protein